VPALNIDMRIITHIRALEADGGTCTITEVRKALKATSHRCRINRMCQWAWFLI
jgi:hypothetical protein